MNSSCCALIEYNIFILQQEEGYYTMDIHIAIAVDNNYIEHCIVLMTSILANKQDEELHFHIIQDGLNFNIKRLLLSFKNCYIHFYNVDNHIFSNYKKTSYYSVSTMWKLICPDLIKTEKLIYLDCDVIVNSSLKELWSFDLKENYIAAIEDANGKKYAKRYKLKACSKFFNAGIMLINCEKWRKDNIAQRAINISTESCNTKLVNDQTILNQLFESRVKFLDLKWNLQYCPINIWPTYDNIKEYKNAIEKPSIIHYTGDFKPWKKGMGCFHPKQKDYLKYHQMSPLGLEDYKQWEIEDKRSFCKGIIAFVKRYPLFFFRKQFWINKLYFNNALSKC